MNILNFANKHRVLGVYLVISLVAIVWNLITMRYSLPWCDEVMLTDTCANKHFWGEWATLAYNDYGEGTFPFCTYFPLHTWLAYAWMSIVGFSFLKMRMLSLVMTAILGGVILRFAREVLGKPVGSGAVVIFSMGFWFSDAMMNIYRMNRPEMEGALMVSLFALYLVRSVRMGKTYRRQLLLTAMLAIMAGVQSALCILLGLVFYAFFIRPVKRLWQPACLAVVGVCLGVVASFLYMGYFGAAKGFALAIMNSSATVMKLYGMVRDVVFPMLGREVHPLALPVGEDVSFWEKLFRVFDYFSLAVLLAASVLLACVNKVWKRPARPGAYFLLFTVFVVVCYNLAGRYTSYYMWTAALPLLLSLLLWCEDGRARVNRVLAALAVLVMVAQGVSRYQVLDGDSPIARVQAFVDRQQFKPTDKVAVPFCTFYAVKPRVRGSYFYQIYPQELMGKMDYVILQLPGKYEDYGMDGMQRYVDGLRQRYTLRQVDACRDPNLVLYQVTDKVR